MFLASPSAEQWKTMELPVNKTIAANVLEIISPALFYAIPSEMSGEEPHCCCAPLLLSCAEQVLRGALVRSEVQKGGDACQEV